MSSAEACDDLGCRYQGQLEALYTALEERQKARLAALREGTGGTVPERVTQVCPGAKPAWTVCGRGGLLGTAGHAVPARSKGAAVLPGFGSYPFRMTSGSLPGKASLLAPMLLVMRQGDQRCWKR